MPKIPRGKSGPDIVRFLKKQGWAVAREGGRHTVLTKDDKIVTVPRHGVIKTGTLASILRVADIDVQTAADGL